MKYSKSCFQNLSEARLKFTKAAIGFKFIKIKPNNALHQPTQKAERSCLSTLAIPQLLFQGSFPLTLKIIPGNLNPANHTRSLLHDVAYYRM